MKRLSSILAGAAMAAAFCACSSNPEESPVFIPAGHTITAYTPAEGSRTHIGSTENNISEVVWSQDDRIAVITEQELLCQYQLVTGDGTSRGTFSPYDPNQSAEGANAIRGVYPHENYDHSDQTVEIPKTQTYEKGSFPKNALPMYAQSEMVDNLLFKHLAAVINLRLTGTAQIKTIDLVSTEKQLAGKGKIVEEDGNFILKFDDKTGAGIEGLGHTDEDGTDLGTGESATDDEGKTITLSCTQPVQLGQEAEEFMIVIPAQTYPQNSLRFIITDNDGNVMVLPLSKQISVGRAKIVDLTPQAYAGQPAAAVGSKEDLATALADETKSLVILENDIDLGDDVLDITTDKTIDLNGNTLSSTLDNHQVLHIKEGSVSISNGIIEFHNTYAGGNKADIVVGDDKSQLPSGEKSDEVISKATVVFDHITLNGSIYVKYGSSVEIRNSEINSELYCVLTNANASTSETEPVTVKISDTKLTGETPVFINVPAQLTMERCTVVGGWQGVMVRGGKADISDCTISLQESYATPVEGTDWLKDRRTGTSKWSDGNEVAIAGITIGNNSPSAYQYPTVVTLKNTDVSGYDGYWAIYADATQVCTVDFSYDSSCTFTPAIDPDKSFRQGIGAGNGYISVTDGTGSTTTY